jgi:prevent-host-death family protein
MEGLAMTYTLAMAAEQGIRIAEDGVAEVSMTYARANLTQLLRDVRYGKRAGAFTERGERSAYVVPPEFYEEAERNRQALQKLRDLVGVPPGVTPGSDPQMYARSQRAYEVLSEIGLTLDF